MILVCLCRRLAGCELATYCSDTTSSWVLGQDCVSEKPPISGGGHLDKSHTAGAKKIVDIRRAPNIIADRGFSSKEDSRFRPENRGAIPRDST